MRSIHWILIVLALGLGACASTTTPARDEAAQPQQVAQDGTLVDASASQKPADAVDINGAIDRALDDGWQDLHLIVECYTDQGWQAAEVFGNGVAIWGQTEQFAMQEEQIRQMLKTIRESDFYAMKQLYGGNIKPDEASKSSALRVTCRVLLDIDGTYKQVAQRAKGEQLQALKDLAADLISTCSKPAKNRLGAEDLNDGLNKLASGKLAPITWSLLINQKPAPATGEDGWLLKIEDKTVKGRVFKQETGYNDPKALDLTAAELERLLSLLSEKQVADLPINLYAEHYTDLTVSVLNQRKKVQARQFAGMKPDQHGEQQVRFDRLIEELHQLHQRVMDTGSATETF